MKNLAIGLARVVKPEGFTWLKGRSSELDENDRFRCYLCIYQNKGVILSVRRSIGRIHLSHSGQP